MTRIEYLRVGGPQLFVPPRQAQVVGPYTLERDIVALYEGLPQVGRLWVDKRTGAYVEEEMLGVPRAFKIVAFDLDGLLVDSERKGGYFDTCWNALYRDARIEGTDEEITALRKRVYRWDAGSTLPSATVAMLKRITDRVDIEGNPLTDKEVQTLTRLFDPATLLRWAAENKTINDRLDYGNPVTDRVVDIIADRKEQIGMQLLADNPHLVRYLAPFKQGVADFFRALPKEVIVAIYSGSRVETTILPILRAHVASDNGWLLDRVGSYIIGEEAMLGLAVKPERRYYELATIFLGQLLYAQGKIPPGGIKFNDMLFIGDTIARSATPDAPTTRKGMHHIVISEQMRRVNLGPLIAVVADFSVLMTVLNQSPAQIENSTLRRLAYTLQR